MDIVTSQEENIRKFSKDAGYKISFLESITFVCTSNDHLKNTVEIGHLYEQ